MHEIKFRAWNKQNNCWADLNELSDWGTATFTAVIGMGNEQYPYRTFSIESDSRYEIQQFSGLKDKNGKEIYEGDIVRSLTGFEEGKVGKVGFGEYVQPFGSDNFTAHIGFYVDWNNDVTRRDLGYWTKNDFCEVIGNIYENPDLV